MAVAGRHTTPPSAAAGDQPAGEAELRTWVAATAGGPVVAWEPIPGGNRCRSWSVDVMRDGARLPLYLRYQPPRPPSAEPYTVWREARVYQALRDTAVPMPRLMAIHPAHQAILTERVRGRADYRRAGGDDVRGAIARDFMRALAVLHRLPLPAGAAPELGPGGSIAACVRHEIAIWRAMYEESVGRDPLIDLALDWLSAHVPQPDLPPVLVHGDAGQGNFLFEDGRMTALLDWELAHIGDPMEDLAWFSMRSVMEPAPDFPGLLRFYAASGGAALDLARIRYHRVFVSTRVVIIRHRNVTGEPANSIVSRALNRRLLIAALADATGVTTQPAAPLAAPETPRTPLFDAVVHDLRYAIADVAQEPGVVAAAKNAAKVAKFLRDADRLGALVDAGDRADLAQILGRPVEDIEAARRAVCDRVRAGQLPFADALQCFANCIAREAQLAADASGGLAARSFPPLPEPALPA